MDEDVQRFLKQAGEIKPGTKPDPAAAKKDLGQGDEHIKGWGGDWMVLLLALTCYKGALEHDAKLAPAYAGVAQVLLDSGYQSDDEFDRTAMREALAWADRGLVVDPTDFRCLEMKAEVLRYMMKLTEAEAILRKLIAREPTKFGPYHTLSSCLAKRKKYDEAVKVLKEGAARVSSDPKKTLEARRSLANLYSDAERHEDAARAFDAVLREDPGHAWTWHNCSISLANLQRYEKAYEYSLKALQLMPFGAAMAVRNGLEEILEKQGKIGLATVKWMRGPA